MKIESLMSYPNFKVYIYPGFDPSRYGFYIQGIERLFKKPNIELTYDHFPALTHHCLPIIINFHDKQIKIYISTGDGPGYNEDGLCWSDIYVKRTLVSELVPLMYKFKIIPGGPHIETRCWGLIDTICTAINIYRLSIDKEFSLSDITRKYIQQYFYRLPEEMYVPSFSERKYIFYASTLYPNHPKYNLYRANFIRASQSISSIAFEGGLIRKDNKKIGKYSDITISKYYSPRLWLKKSAESFVSFWAPGDQGAMTLKLGEFLALGKAIIAVPIRQEMLPSPLIHGEHVHFIDGSVKDIQKAITALADDNEYRQKLERNARKYYEEWVAPQEAIRRYVNEGCKRIGINYSRIQ